MAGITPTGFVAKSASDVESDVETGMRENVAADIDLGDGTPLGEFSKIVASEAAEAWAVAKGCYEMLNPANASGFTLDGVASITGTKRSKPTYSTVVCSMGLDPNTTIAAGSMCNVAGDAKNTWTLLGPADPTTGALLSSGPVTSIAAGTYTGLFQATTPGPIEALAGTLTVITNTVTGWNSVTNPKDALAGKDREDDDDLKAKRETELAANGGSTVDALVAGLREVPNVIQAFVYENTSDWTDANGVPPHGLHVVIYDSASTPADNGVIAATIFAQRGQGVPTSGAISVNVTDGSGVVHAVRFDRAQVIPIYFAVTVKTDPKTFDAVNGPAAIKLAMTTAGLRQGLGDSVIKLRYEAAVLGVPGVTDVPSFALDTAPSPTSTTNIVISGLQVATLDSTRIAVTVT